MKPEPTIEERLRRLDPIAPPLDLRAAIVALERSTTARAAPSLTRPFAFAAAAVFVAFVVRIGFVAPMMERPARDSLSRKRITALESDSPAMRLAALCPVRPRRSFSSGAFTAFAESTSGALR